MISDCEICDRKKVPCSSCQESQRAICFICQGDVADPYCELEHDRDGKIIELQDGYSFSCAKCGAAA